MAYTTRFKKLKLPLYWSLKDKKHHSKSSLRVEPQFNQNYGILVFRFKREQRLGVKIELTD